MTANFPSVTLNLDCILTSTELLVHDIKSSHHILYYKADQTTKTTTVEYYMLCEITFACCYG